MFGFDFISPPYQTFNYMSLLNRISFITYKSSPAPRLASLRSPVSSPLRSSRTMATIPKTMKAVSIAKTGGVEVLEYKTDVPVPEPKEGELLVKNDFIGINFIDT